MTFEVIITVLKAIFKKPATQKEKYLHPDCFRGTLVFNKKKCVGCAVCSKVCPSDACKINKKIRKSVFDLNKCVMCGNCVRACKFSALSFEPKS